MKFYQHPNFPTLKNDLPRSRTSPLLVFIQIGILRSSTISIFFLEGIFMLGKLSVEQLLVLTIYLLVPIQLLMSKQVATLQSIALQHQKMLQLMHNHAVARNQQTVRQVYNRDSRNIAKFIRQQIEFERKSKLPQKTQRPATPPKRKRFGVTLRYDDNQALEIEYPLSEPQNAKRNDSSTNNHSDYRLSSVIKSTKKGFRKTGKTGIRFEALPPTTNTLQRQTNRKKSYSVSSPIRRTSSPARNCSPVPSNQRRPTVRRRVATQYDQSPSPREEVSQPQAQQAVSEIIVMNRHKMERFMRSLHRMAWMARFLRGKDQEAEHSDAFRDHMRQFNLDFDSSIQSEDLNYMVARRYQLLTYHLVDVYQQRKKFLDQHESSVQRQKLADTNQYCLLDSLSKHSILNIIHRKVPEPQGGPLHARARHSEEQKEEKKVYFSLPYAQFISERQTKSSIYRLVAMSPLVCLRMAFSLYDKNRNSKIDEDDLLQAISLSRKMPQLQPDILVMASIMLSPQRRLSKIKHRRQLTEPVRTLHGTNLSVLPIESELISSFTPSMPIQEEDSQEEETITANSRFSLDKFYTFLKEKQQAKKENQPVSSEQMVIPLNFISFCKVFKNKKPAIVYDLLQYLLGAQKQDFADSYDLNITQQQQPSAILKRLQVQAETQATEESLQQKWNYRLKSTNSILQQLLNNSHRY